MKKLLCVLALVAGFLFVTAGDAFAPLVLKLPEQGSGSSSSSGSGSSSDSSSGSSTTTTDTTSVVV